MRRLNFKLKKNLWDIRVRYKHQKYITDTSLARQKVWVVLDIQTQQPIAVTQIGGTKRFGVSPCECLVSKKRDMRRHMYVQSLINQSH